MTTRLIRRLLPHAARAPGAEERATIPLDRALLCLDCESIYAAHGPSSCPACGSHAAWALGRLVGGCARRPLAA